MAPAPTNQVQIDDGDLEMDDHERIVEENIVAEKIINEEYKIWKKNSPFLYDLVISSALEWPTLTTQWFPDKEVHPGKNYTTHRLLLGTHTSGNDQNYLQIAHVNLPNMEDALDLRQYDEEKEEIGGYSASESRISIYQRIDHEGEVNRARYMPQNPDIIATMSVSGDVLVFDRTKHSLQPTGVCRPEMRLVGHTKEGYGLSWNSHKHGHLLTGSEDTTVALWDVNNYTKQNTTLSSVKTFTTHTAIVNDVAWHNLHDSLFGTVSDDLTLQIHDTRSTSATPVQKVQAHAEAVNAISFNSASEYILATASADKTVALWDLRKLSICLHSLQGHNDDVTCLQWSPHEETILASASHDRRVIIWDVSRIGQEQTQEDAEDGPPELLFIHGGHTNRISDFSWSPTMPWVMASAAEDNLLQVWKPADSIVAVDEKDVSASELE
ncbi:WD40-repeat-containing domain protein [Lipomyces tetrasporus]|uniref:WD40-repeat-containing domain protein n=1 Tax=Lipomyces tetrasporus TaxID=54092 RepID=A0AAD7QUJ1_9ASCO|nr:WD40-repeat-containing domain protein [Lipomyces tetrasporus]KAJ8099992.1 WD40-repeat-containing domain protein [Lipomyces tetrasporus]